MRDRETLVIDVLAVSYMHDNDSDIMIFDRAQKPIIPHAKAPEMRQSPCQLMTKVSRIFQTTDFLFQKGHDFNLNRLIKFG